MGARALCRDTCFILLLALLFGQGCFVARPTRLSDLNPGRRMRLASDSGFVIRQLAASPPAPAVEGRAWGLSAEFVNVRADTLLLRGIRFTGRRNLGTEWRLRDAAVVVLSENPGLRLERNRFSPAHTLAFVVIAPAVTWVLVVFGSGWFSY
jgi:hypothetical protein